MVDIVAEFSEDIGGDGTIISSGTDPVTGLKNGGWVENFPKALEQTVAVALHVNTKAGEVNDAAQAAEASAATALAAPGTNATSTTSDTIATGSTTITIQTGKSFVVGMYVSIARTSAPANAMFGAITAYNSGTGSLTVLVDDITGSGTYTDWTVALSGRKGATGATGAAGQPVTGGALTDYSVTSVANGNTGSGTVTLNLNSGNYHTSTRTGAFTLAFSNIPSGVYHEWFWKLTNGGAGAFTFPTINWVRFDGTLTTSFATYGITLQTSGVDWFVFWTDDGGTTIYGKVLR